MAAGSNSQQIHHHTASILGPLLPISDLLAEFEFPEHFTARMFMTVQ